MPLDEEYDDDLPKSQKVSLKNVSSQKSIFENVPKKQTSSDLESKVKKMQEKESSYKVKAAELALRFNKLISDKTLSQNKSIFQKEIEKELLSEMIQFSMDLNSDPEEVEDMGSLSWITLLLKIAFFQRDKINDLDFSISKLKQEIEILKGIDKNKNNG